MDFKECRNCKEDKPVDQFSPDRRNLDGLQAWCRKCQREYRAKVKYTKSESYRASKKKSDAKYYEANKLELNVKEQNRKLKSRYGITMEDYERMVLEQDGKCGICETSDPGGRGKRFHVDHDHEDGRVRGLLCWTCNRRLGVLEDRQFVKAAVDYLRGITNGHC